MAFDFDLENPFSTSTDNFVLLFHIENDHIPSKAYIQAAKSNPLTRTQIVSFILYICRNFDVFSSYLAINYMDRFLSTTSITEEKLKPCILKVIAVSCITLALKMRKIEFSVSDIQLDWDDGGVILDSATIERTEMLILGALKWRMRSVNPFSFISYFIPLLGIQDQTSIQALKDGTTEIILRAQNDINLLEFKPSAVCAAALLLTASEMIPTQHTHFRNSLCHCEHVNKVELFKCYGVMQGASTAKRPASASPDNVLDLQLQCSTSSTSQNKTTEIRCPKRRKFAQHIVEDVD